MSDAEMIAAVIGVVAMARKASAKLDGAMVYLTAFIAGMVLSILYSAPVSVREMLQHGLQVSLGAIGIMAGVSYGTSKMGTAVGKAATIHPPPMPDHVNNVVIAPLPPMVVNFPIEKDVLK